MKKTLFAAALVAATLGAGAASAKNLPNGGVTAQEVAAVLMAKGYRAEIGVDSVGDPMIKSGADGSDFRVLFYNCKTGRCTSIQFTAAWDLSKGSTLELMNRWNREKRFGRAFLDSVMDPFVQMDMDLEEGATTELVATNVDTWVAVLREFKKFAL